MKKLIILLILALGILSGCANNVEMVAPVSMEVPGGK